MTGKTASVHARIQPSLKAQAEAILEKLGISTSEAISIYYSQIALQQGLPFDVKLPNKATRKAMIEARTRRNLHSAVDADALMRQLGVTLSLEANVED